MSRLAPLADLLRKAGIAWWVTHDQEGLEYVILTDDPLDGVEAEILSLLPGAALEEEYQDFHGPRDREAWKFAIFTGVQGA